MAKIAGTLALLSFATLVAALSLVVVPVLWIARSVERVAKG
jgi:hypothetical protein